MMLRENHIGERISDVEEPDNFNPPDGDDLLKPSVNRSDLDRIWIGHGAALDWIAMRGQPMSLAQHRMWEDETD